MMSLSWSKHFTQGDDQVGSDVFDAKLGSNQVLKFSHFISVRINT